MNELEALLKSVEGRSFVGAATERITGAREGLWNMQNKPQISFKCGPYALQQILLSDQKLRTSSPTNAGMEIANAASTQEGFSLPQVAELSRKVGLNYQMAFRQKGNGDELGRRVSTAINALTATRRSLASHSLVRGRRGRSCSYKPVTTIPTFEPHTPTIAVRVPAKIIRR